MAVTIRDQNDADADAVAALIGVAFADEPAVVGLEADLARRSDSHGFVAVADGVVVGHVRLTRGWIDADERMVEALVLSPLSVHPERQRRGVGSALVAHAVGAAELLGAPAVFLEGDPGYYGRLGWRPASDVGVSAPSRRIPGPAFQVVTLAGFRPWMRGRLVYPETFWTHDAVGLRGAVRAEVEEALDRSDDPSAGAASAGELALLDPHVRGDRAGVDALLASEFVEFGSSGRVLGRVEIIDALEADPGGARHVADLSTRRLGADAVLVTYTLVGEPGSLRSSVWVRGDDAQWRLLFHQGTPRATGTVTP